MAMWRAQSSRVPRSEMRHICFNNKKLLKFLIIFEQRILTCHFAVSLKIDAASPI